MADFPALPNELSLSPVDSVDLSTGLNGTDNLITFEQSKKGKLQVQSRIIPKVIIIHVYRDGFR